VAQASAKPVAQASAKPVAQASAKPVAQPSAKPVAQASAKPVAQASAKPAAQPAPQTSYPVPQDLPPDELVGTTIDNYEIQARMAVRSFETLYRARQTNVDRLVVLRLLNSEQSKDPAAEARFKADIRAKARVSHTLVVAVYEGGVAHGLPYYSSEYVGAPTLALLRENGVSIDGLTALHIIKMVADVLDCFIRHHIEHNPLEAQSILLKPGAPPRMANIACQELAEPLDPQAEIRALGAMILEALDPSKSSNAARGVAAKLRNNKPEEPLTWAAVAALAEAQMPKSAPTDVDKIQAQDIALLRAVDVSKKKSRRGVLIGSAVSLAVTITACYFVFQALTKTRIKVGDLGAMIKVPAGEFQFQDKRITLPEFYISKYEVTIAEYAAFLRFLEANPTQADTFKHPEQPSGKSHVPAGWADMTEIDPPNPGYYNRAKTWGQYNGAPLTVDSPVIGVDWFDAYDYAKWKGQRLPTEQEWEKAARGKVGGQHPWGNENTIDRANTGLDFTSNPSPQKGGEKDGFKRSSPVNKPKTDKSDYGVVGTGGNVSEWTDTWDQDAMQSGSKVPVYRGGNWKTNDKATAMRRGTKLTELQSDDALGFRTASDKPESTTKP
jgi:formylglycine-generating enzyme required for sulfatase activity